VHEQAFDLGVDSEQVFVVQCDESEQVFEARSRDVGRI
jgi:hypothetical protein